MGWEEGEVGREGGPTHPIPASRVILWFRCKVYFTQSPYLPTASGNDPPHQGSVRQFPRQGAPPPFQKFQSPQWAILSSLNNMLTIFCMFCVSEGRESWSRLGLKTKGTKTLGLVLNFGTCLVSDEFFGTVSSRSRLIGLIFT